MQKLSADAWNNLRLHAPHCRKITSRWNLNYRILKGEIWDITFVLWAYQSQLRALSARSQTRSHLPCEAAHLSREARGCGCGPSLKHPTTSLLWVWGHSKYDCLSVTTVDKRSIRIPSQSLRRMLLHAFFTPFKIRKSAGSALVILTYCLIHAFLFFQHFHCLSNSRLIFFCILNLLDEHGISV